MNLSLAFPLSFHFAKDFEVIREFLREEQTPDPRVKWVKSPETGKLTHLEFGFLFPLWVSIDIASRKIILRYNEKQLPFGYSYFSMVSNLLSGFFWTLSGRVALHANAISFDGKNVIAFTGTSGRGKSTLTSYLLSQNAEFVSDDILTVEERANVSRLGSKLKLWPTSLSLLGLSEYSNLKAKAYLDPSLIGGRLFQGEGRLTHLFLLEEWDKTESIHAEKVMAAASPLVLIENGYYPGLLVKEMPQLFYAYADLASKISIYRLHYPRVAEALPKVKKLVQEIVNGIN